jgi:translation initiation factor 1
MRNSNPTVYSTESGRICPDCGKPIAECICRKPQRPSGDGIVRVQRDSKRRKGKTVTLISGVQLDGEQLRGLLSDLKRLCGSGGTFKDGIIEIQGDHRDTVFEALKKKGFNVKKAGG